MTLRLIDGKSKMKTSRKWIIFISASMVDRKHKPKLCQTVVVTFVYVFELFNAQPKSYVGT